MAARKPASNLSSFAPSPAPSGAAPGSSRRLRRQARMRSTDFPAPSIPSGVKFIGER